MRQGIRSRLAKIQDCYPDERLARSKERWRRLWAGEPPLDRLPFVAVPINIGYDAVDSAEDRLVVVPCGWRRSSKAGFASCAARLLTCAAWTSA
jgi:hypothetical protein